MFWDTDPCCDGCMVCWAGVHNDPMKCPYYFDVVREAKRLKNEKVRNNIMSQKRTVMYKCDRCGAVDYFEQNIPGAGAKWGQAIDNSVHMRTVDLCPDCLDAYRELTKDFFNTEE